MGGNKDKLVEKYFSEPLNTDTYIMHHIMEILASTGLIFYVLQTYGCIQFLKVYAVQVPGKISSPSW